MRLPERIAARLAEPTSRRERSMLACRLAIYRTLRGDHEAASRQVSVLRAGSNPGVDSMAVILANIAEAVVLVHADDPEAGADRLRRARAMALGVGDREAASMALAWLAHLQLRESGFGELLALARAAVDQGALEFDHVRARLALDVASALHRLDRYDLARPWYETARLACVAQVDDAMLNHLIFTDALGRLAQVRWAEIEGGTARASAEHAGLSIASSFNYDRATGSRALTWKLPLMNAQFLACTGRYAEARSLFEEWLPLVSMTDDADFGGICRADYNLALVCTGNLSRWEGYLAGVQTADEAGAGAGVDVFVLARVARILEVVGQAARGEAAMQRCRQGLERRSAWRSEFLRAYFDTLGHLPSGWSPQRPAVTVPGRDKGNVGGGATTQDS
jgi:hypothetical protein